MFRKRAIKLDTKRYSENYVKLELYRPAQALKSRLGSIHLRGAFSCPAAFV
jgi:hypothetical protein